MPGVMRPLAALAAVAALLALPATASPAAGPRSLASSNRLAAQVLRDLNALRGDHELRPLRPNLALTVAADEHALEMVENGYFAHESLDGTPYWKRLARFYRPGRDPARWSVGENLYWASPSVTAARAIRMWMQSPHHRMNLLSPAWRDVGIAAVRARAVPGAFMGLSVTVLAVDFGVR